MYKMPSKTAVSSGAIIIRDIGGELRIALGKDVDKGDNAWVLPKGHVRQGEMIEETALRETREEIGLTKVQLIMYLGSIERESLEDWGEKVMKTIHVFLAYALGDEAGGLANPNTESELRWCSINEALELIPFREDREFIKKHLAEMIDK